MKRIAGKTKFDIAHEDTIFAMKSWLISQRVRSRDLLDLMTMLQRGKTIQGILEAGAQADPAYQREYAKEVLVGNVPLDAAAEGFDSIGLEISTGDIHQFFLDAVNEYETEVAAEIIRSRAG
ncbi:MAG: hypothetical protein EPO42_01655 [Gallionellaceae bacterium]|nr:MAG: hypothetical protein EPO42_01655 [Gallionellaceae bacterium]